MKNRRKNNNAVWGIVAILAIGFVSLTIQINQLMAIQTELVSDLSEVEYLSSSSQRVSRMVITGNHDVKTIFYVADQTLKCLGEDGDEQLSALNREDVRMAANEVLENWETLYDLMIDAGNATEEEQGTIENYLILAADNYYNTMTTLALLLGDETIVMNESIQQLQVYSYLLLAIIAFFIINHLVVTSMALKRSVELASIASVDIATGLFNRSKCQDIFKETYGKDLQQTPAMVVIDLNDLKQTNDTQGHRVGDELIATFAKLLQDAANTHEVKPFLGRYGGDEFVVFHRNINAESEITTFTKELKYLADEYNKNDQKKFAISYALGYAIKTGEQSNMTTRQLFDEADEKMYANKQLMKKERLKAQEDVALDANQDKT